MAMTTLFTVLYNSLNYLFYTGLDLVGEEPIKAMQRNVIYTFENWGPAYEVTLDLKINNWSSPDPFAVILQLTKGGNCCEPGQREPAILTARDQEQIHVYFDSLHFVPHTLEIGKWYFIMISKKKEKVCSNYTFFQKLFLYFRFLTHNINGYLN